MNASALESRDANIVAMLRNGKSARTVAKKFLVTTARVYQIRRAAVMRGAMAIHCADTIIATADTAPCTPVMKVAETCPKWLIGKVQGAIVDHFTAGLNGNLAEVSAALAWLGREVR